MLFLKKLGQKSVLAFRTTEARLFSFMIMSSRGTLGGAIALDNSTINTVSAVHPAVIICPKLRIFRKLIKILQSPYFPKMGNMEIAKFLMSFLAISIFKKLELLDYLQREIKGLNEIRLPKIKSCNKGLYTSNQKKGLSPTRKDIPS